MSQCQNGAAPMFFDITNVTVTPDKRTLTWGIAAEIGTPPQVLSLYPSSVDNDLYVGNTADCAPSDDACTGYEGGLFDAKASSSFHKVSQGQWNGTADPNPNSIPYVYFNDVMSFGNATVDGFPAVFDEKNFGGQSHLPLGWNSDFLKSLFDIGAVPSKAWAHWSGCWSHNNPVDGSLVVGGYDVTRYTGELTTFHATPKCPTCVVVTGLTYDTHNESVSLFKNPSDTLEVSLNPYASVLELTSDMLVNFAAATNTTWNSGLGYLWWNPSEKPTGNLTVTLNNNYTTTIAADDFIQYPSGYNNNGVYVIADDTYVVAQLSLPQNLTKGIATWGFPYLTMNYLIADYARSQFQMAPAIRTNFDLQGGGYQLAAICDPPVKTTPSPTSPAATTTSAAVAVGAGAKNTGALVGGIVGGVLGLILIVGLLALLFYRNRHKRHSVTAPAAMTETHAGGAGAVTGFRPPQRGESYYSEPSQYTATSPTTAVAASELSGTNISKQGGITSVDEWLSSHAKEHAISKNVDRPSEMPADRYEDPA